MKKNCSLDKIILATSNTSKKREILSLLEPLGLDIIFGDNVLVDAPEETGRTFCENALIKARAYQFDHYPVLADDSGLVIPALENRPGIHSSRFAADLGGYEMAFKRLEEQLVPAKRQARLECCLVFLWPEGKAEFFEGQVEGTLVFPARGNFGHGYDPVFQPNGCDKTFSEMTLEEKMNLSHRGVALQKMLKQCF